MIGEWLTAIAADHDASTVKTYGFYSREFPHDLSAEAIAEWRRGQLRVVCAATAKKKTSALRQLCFYLCERGYLTAMPEVKPLPPRALGTRDTRRRHKLHAVPLTMEQAAAWVMALPEWSAHGRGHYHRYRVRARFIVALNTALRPGTLDRLRAPEDYRRGAAELRIRDEADKARFGRVLTLDPLSRAALDSACPDVGLIFGHHHYEKALRRAARETLPPELAEAVTAYDLRHCRLTWMLENSRNLAGVAYQSGHRRCDTLSAYYIHPSRRAQESVLREMEQARQLTLPGLDTDDED